MVFPGCSCHLLCDHFQFILTHGPNIPRFLCNIVLYSIRLYFHHQSHPQLGIVFTLALSPYSSCQTGDDKRNIDILGISELKWTGMSEFNSDDHYIYYCGQVSLRRNGVAFTVNKGVQNALLGFSLNNNKMISVRFPG